MDDIKDEIENTQIVVLAGGAAKRMGSNEPKALLKLNGKPLIDYCIELYKNCGFKNFVLLLGYKSNEIKKYIEEKNFGVNIKISVEPDTCKGKGKALKYALQNGSLDKNKRVIIHFPDDILLDKRLPIRLLLHHLHGVETLHTVATNVFVSGTFYPFGTGEIDNRGIVTTFIEKPFIDKLTNTGMCIFEPEVYEYIEKLIDMNSKEPIEFEKTVLPKLASERKLYSMVLSPDIWISINTQKEYEDAEKIVSNYLKLNKT